MDVVRQCLRHARNTAIVSSSGSDVVLHRDLITRALHIRHAIRDALDWVPPNPPKNVAITTDALSSFASALFGSWMAGAVAVPVPPSHPDDSIEYMLRDSRPELVLCDEAHVDRMRALHPRVLPISFLIPPPRDVPRLLSPPLLLEDAIDALGRNDRRWRDDDHALILYTSGTTGRPKGVVHSHGSLAAQVHALSQAWRLSERDRILHCLPLHHIHGVVNALLLPLYVGGSVHALPHFSVRAVFEALHEQSSMVFMGVPTMYSYLARHVAKLDGDDDRTVAVDAIRSIRSQSLWICGSSAMPLPLIRQWKALSGTFPLERYGMTETGMILGNPLEPDLRRPGTVGLPFPGMEVDIRENGELWCRGRQLFSGYWGMPEATAESFDVDGWFRTGDTADMDDDGYVSLLGRTSSDIIKHKGYKISALQIESILLQHDLIEEACVFGAPDEDAGETIVAVVCGVPDATSDADLEGWCRGKLPAYQVPSAWLRLETLPRNSMGKVNKVQLKRETLFLR